MQIKDFNRPPQAPDASPPGRQADGAHAGEATASVPPPDGSAEAPRGQAEAALLRARIEHLELVVETARSLMTSNQERLLRRLHELPHEMMALTARLARIDAADPARTSYYDDDAIRATLRRVK